MKSKFKIKKGQDGLDTEDLWGTGSKQAGIGPEESLVDVQVQQQPVQPPTNVFYHPTTAKYDQSWSGGPQVDVPLVHQYKFAPGMERTQDADADASSDTSSTKTGTTSTKTGATKSNSGYTWKTSDGIDLSKFGWTYDHTLSAKENRTQLKKLLKGQGLGDKADATGMIAEYLQQYGSDDPTKISASDRKWLNNRRSQYGYTTDEQGNRDYYRKGTNWGRALATVAGGLVLGPTGAFIGNMLAGSKTPSGGKDGFYNAALDGNKPKSNPISTNIYDYNIQGAIRNGDGTYTKDDYTYQFGDESLNYYGKSPYGANSPLQSYGTVDQQGNHTFQGYGMRDADGNFKPVTKATIGNTTYNYNNGKWINVHSSGIQSELMYNDQDGKWYQNGTAVTDPNQIKFSKKGGKMQKFQQGGQVDQQEQVLLMATLGLIGYAESQGNDVDVETAVTQVLSIVQQDPKQIDQLVQNKKLVQAGAKSLQTKNPELFKQLQQPGAMKQLINQIVNKQQKTTKAMNGTKLNYIKELKGICPEGYEVEYFAAGGHICSRCARKKQIEEAKCGKKMKAKKHEGGGGVSTAVNEVKEDMQKNKKDSTSTKQTQSKTTFDDGRDKNLLKTSPKTYDKAKHQKLIKEFRKNGTSYKGWSKAKIDSLTRYNALLASDEDGDWSF